MAKLERVVREPFDSVVQRIIDGIMQGSVSASFEDRTIWRGEGIQCAHLVFERYSYMGNNRVSLSVCVLQQGDGPVRISGITSGGSQAMFFKINTLGEEAFLQKLEELL
jgi:hypothetical protein